VNFECIADGKIYVMGGHLYSPPLFHGGQLYCINATSGDLIWSSPSFAITNGANCGISDGYLVVPNAYDNRLYCYGKGQTATTVEAPMTAITAGDSVVIQGTVTDQSSGAKGTPAISDASMGAWMEFIYMQQPCPTNATGVEVTIDAVDPNNNFINIGTATSDAYGTFGYAWKTPNVPGKYMIIATFAGSESYYASYAETYAVVTEAPAATPTPTPLTLPPTETYFAVSTIAIIIAIAIVGILLLRKK
jgi:outer membrane protein assembly factor BamB